MVAVPVRFVTLTFIKPAPPAAKPQGVIGPLAEVLEWFARPSCGRAKEGPSVLAAALRMCRSPQGESGPIILLFRLPAH